MVVERFNRSIRNKITQYMEAYETHNYFDVLDKLVQNNNTTKHSSINMSP